MTHSIDCDSDGDAEIEVGTADLMWNPFSRYETHKCPDGRTLRTLKNPKKEFPLSKSQQALKMKGGAKGTLNEEASFDTSMASRIDALFVVIDDINGSHMMQMQSIHYAFNSNPCDDPTYIQRKTSELQENQDRLRRAKLQLEAVAREVASAPENERQRIDILAEICRDLREIDPAAMPDRLSFEPDDAVREISDARRAAHRLALPPQGVEGSSGD